ncbi:MAG: RNase adapter RapZ [Desulfobulbus sp.]|nr:RNase adapter RapZ [Desulfobulbus sp.]
MQISLFSFGFKHGHPEADLVWDVRFLPNPYWDAGLKPYTGRDPRVASYALENAAGAQFFTLLEPLLTFLVKQYTEGGRETLTLAVGCTGGKHRSVAVAERLSRFLRGLDCAIDLFHRDIDKE